MRVAPHLQRHVMEIPNQPSQTSRIPQLNPSTHAELVRPTVGKTQRAYSAESAGSAGSLQSS